MDASTYIKSKIIQINNALDSLLPPSDLSPETLHQAMRYSIFAGGKRLRPVLCLATAEALGTDSSPYLPFACALELIHTYSLIHDDLPAMDDDDLRRGLPTCHKKFGEAHAILAGDALLTYAFNLMIKTRENGVTAEKILQAMEETAYSAGLKGMIIGQVLDIESENKEISLEQLKTIHAHKTGALFRASIRAGAILSGASANQLQHLTEYAEQLGLAFQITDDILDVTGDTEKIGKLVGSDERNQKATYPALVGLKQAQCMAEETVARALDNLEMFDHRAEPLRAIAKLVINREN